MMLIHVAQIEKLKRAYVWLTLLKTHISGDVSVVVKIRNLTQSNAYRSDWIVSGRTFMYYTLCVRCDKYGRIDDTSRAEQTEDVDVKPLIKLCTAQCYVLSYFLSSNFRHRRTVIRLIIFLLLWHASSNARILVEHREREKEKKKKRHRYCIGYNAEMKCASRYEFRWRAFFSSLVCFSSIYFYTASAKRWHWQWHFEELRKGISIPFYCFSFIPVVFGETCTMYVLLTSSTNWFHRHSAPKSKSTVDALSLWYWNTRKEIDFRQSKIDFCSLFWNELPILHI